MDLSYALTWMIGTSAAFGLALSIERLRAGIRGTFLVNLALLVLVGLGLLTHWDGVGYAALLLWFVLVIVPANALRGAQTAIHRHQLDRAALCARIAGVLHPFDGQREQARMIASQACFDRGELAAAKGELYPLLKSNAWSECAKLELLRLDGRWPLIVQHAKAQLVGKRDLKLAPLYLRALGEVGDIDAMWIMYGQIPSLLGHQPIMRLQMASYSGQSELVELLLGRYFRQMPRNTAEVVRATTMLAEGHNEHAERILHTIARSQGEGSHLARQRLAQRVGRAKVEDLSAAAAAVLSNFIREVRSDATSLEGLGKSQRVWATPLLIAIMVLLFLIGVPGGTTDPENLVNLGALVVPSEFTHGGVVWRIVAAGFLHLGSTHLVMNCLGLWVLGRQLEQIWNGVTLLLVFLASSVTSFGFAAAFVHATMSEPRIFLGASSGVMGFVGALGTFLAVGYLRHRRQALGRRLLLVVAVVLAQLVFDYYTPIVSSMLHLTGLAVGAIVAIPLAWHTWRKLGRQRK